MQNQFEHYILSYNANANSIGNLENIIAEIKTSSYDILLIAWPLTTLKDIITCEGKRKIYTEPLSELIEVERTIVKAINFMLAYAELPNSFQVQVSGIVNMSNYITDTFENYIFPLLDSKATSPNV